MESSEDQSSTTQDSSDLLSKQLEVKQWIEEVLGEKFNDGLSDVLHDSKVLCRLMNAINPDSIAEVHYNIDPIPNMKCMENINLFVAECRKLGVKQSSLFMAVDLFEEKNLELVYNCILQLRRIYQRKQQIKKKRRSGDGAGLLLITAPTKAVKSFFSFASRSFVATKNHFVIPLIVGITFGFGIRIGRSFYLKAANIFIQSVQGSPSSTSSPI